MPRSQLWRRGWPAGCRYRLLKVRSLEGIERQAGWYQVRLRAVAASGRCCSAWPVEAELGFRAFRARGLTGWWAAAARAAARGGQGEEGDSLAASPGRENR